MSENPANETNVNQEGVKQKRKWIITAIVILCIVVLVGLFFLFKSDPVKDFTNAMSINDFTAAATIYNEKMSEQNQSEVTPLIIEQIKQIEKDFKVKSTNFDGANARFKNLELIVKDSVPELIQTRNRVQALNTSRVTFERGANELNAGNYEAAINILSTITESDGNYLQATEAIEQAKSLYKDETIQTIASMTDDALFDDALSAIDTALVTFPDDTELLEQRENAINLREEQRMEEYYAKVAQLEAEQLEKERQEQEAKAAEKIEEDERKAEWREKNKDILEQLKSEQLIFVSAITSDENGEVWLHLEPADSIRRLSYSLDKVTVLFYDLDGNPLAGDDHVRERRGYLKVKYREDNSGVLSLGSVPTSVPNGKFIAIGCVTEGTYWPANIHAEPERFGNDYYSLWMTQYKNTNFFTANSLS